MSDPTPRIASGNRHSSFVVRVWTEPATLPSAPGAAGDADEVANLAGGAVAGPRLRGSVEHVGSRALRYFASLEAMREIIAKVVDVERSSSFDLTPPDSSLNVR